MAKQQVQQKTKQQAPQQKQVPNTSLTPFIFNSTNYIIMIAGVVVIAVGFWLMTAESTTDPNVFPKEELYSFQRITLAPIVVMFGFAIEVFAILKRPKAE